MTRQEYEIYLLYKRFIPEKAHDYLIKCRKRDRMEEFCTNHSLKVVYIEISDDSWIEKTVYSYEFSAKDIEEYTDYQWITIHSSYDCTGREFTRDIRCFPVNGKTIVYHFKALDI